MTLPRAARVFRPALLALSLVAVAACHSEAPPAQAPVAAPETLGPSGRTDIPFVFSWKPVPGSNVVYRVRVVDAAERVLYERDLRATQCPPSSELKAMMADHSTFAWTVSVLSDDGTHEVAKSAPLQFALK